MSNKINTLQYVHVRVAAGAGRESWKKKSEDHFEISVKEKAKGNMANARVLGLMAGHFKVPINKVRIVNGHHHPSKLLVIG